MKSTASVLVSAFATRGLSADVYRPPILDRPESLIREDSGNRAAGASREPAA
jgi:hypothetical protein